MIYFLGNVGLKKRRELSSQLTSLDRALLKRTAARPNGCDIYSLLDSGKPYLSNGVKKFATSDDVRASVRKLVKLELLGER